MKPILIWCDHWRKAKDQFYVDYSKPSPSTSCENEATLFYAVQFKNGVKTEIWSARCKEHPREREPFNAKDASKVFMATRITKEEYLVAKLMES